MLRSAWMFTLCGQDGKELGDGKRNGNALLILSLQGTRLRKPSVTRIAGCVAEEDHFHWTPRLRHALSG
jgi:hypothetical protein